MSSFVREASTTSAASSATTAASAPTTTTTAAASAATAATAANDTNSSSPDSSRDTGGARQQSPSSDSGSLMGRLPAVLRPPLGTTAAQSVVQPATSGTTRSQTQSQAQPLQAGGRNLTALGRRPLYPSEGLAGAYSGGSPPPMQMQMQTPYFSDGGGRLTTGSSFNQHNLSPVSSPTLMGENWAQNSVAPTTTPSSMSSRSLKRHMQQAFGSPSYNHDGYTRSAASNGGSIVSNVGMIMTQGQQPVQNTAGVPVGSPTGTPSTTMGSRRGTSNTTNTSIAVNNSSGRHRQSQMQQMYGAPPSEDPLQYKPSGEARHPRDNTRYETWTSKQLRKKCSHLKLRGLKNVKKHVMVEALYRYYRNQRLKNMADASAAGGNVGSQPPNMLTQQQQRRMEPRQASIDGSSTGGRPDMQYRLRYDQHNSTPPTQAQYGPHSSRSRSYNYGSQSPSPPSSGGDSAGPPKSSNSRGYYVDEESKSESQYKEVPVTSEDVIRLVDVVLSTEFVDRLAAELSRWQFWVDVREMYIGLLHRQHPLRSAGARNGEEDPANTGSNVTNSRNFKWSSMQLWEIWKELSFAYTKTCFVFTAAGMNKRVDDREYINFCDGRPDVYYLHQRLHARPDLLHLIKSNEYIDEKCTSEASETIANEQQQAGPLMGSGPPILRNHKRYKRSGPMVGSGGAASAYNNTRAITAYRASDGTAGADGARASGTGNSGNNNADRGSGDSRGHSPEANSTENSETTGEDSNTASSSNSSIDVSMRAALAEQKYFGLLLQNFEVIFESLHSKKVLLATLRKDSKAPDHLIADLHDDIHVLSALKKEFRNKLRHTMQ